MALSDPFQTTFEGAKTGLGTIGAGIMSATEKISKQNRTMNMLKQFGILKEEEEPTTLGDIEKFAKSKGAEVNISKDLSEEEQLSTAQKLIQSLGLSMPKKTKTIFDLKKATEAGVEFDSEGNLKIKPERPKGVSITDASDLTSQQQLQARALARKIYGVRGAEYGLPAVYEEIRKGKNIDQIEDELRFAGQSKEFVGPVREAAQNIMMGADTNKTQGVMDFIDDSLSKGDTEGVKAGLKRATLKQAGIDDQRATVGKERTIKLLDEVQDDLNTLEKSGINTNIFTGTAEEVARKVLGTAMQPELRQIATKIQAAIQSYRRSMTGVQFGMPENKEYKAMFPGINRTANFNTAAINGLKDALSGDLDNFYSLSMGEDNYRKLFKEEGGRQQKVQPKVSGFKAGDTQVKNGITYKRDEAGKWHPQS